MTFLPVLTVDCYNKIKPLQQIEGNFGLLATVQSSPRFLNHIRSMGKPLYLDSDVFNHGPKWYLREVRTWVGSTWLREWKLDEAGIRQIVQAYLHKCDRFNPDYAFGLDVIGHPLLSLHLTRICMEEWQSRPYGFKLIGIVQAGHPFYEWRSAQVPGGFSQPPDRAITFVQELVSEYRRMGLSQVALGGLLKHDPIKPMNLAFGLNPNTLDTVLQQIRVDFILGGLALSRLDVLKKHGVAADSTNWLWWSPKYDAQRFSDSSVLHSVINS